MANLSSNYRNMTVSVFGINHKTADLSTREKVSFDEARSAILLQDIIADTAATQAFVLSTCNRTEIYTDTQNGQDVLPVLLRHCAIEESVLSNACYQYQGQLAVEHLMKVACGLDSMVLGEAEILGQVKAAIAFAKAQGCLGNEFAHLAREVFTLAKHIRATTQVGACPVSVASIAVRQAQAQLGDLSQQKILLLGAGDTIQLVIKYLARYGVKRVTIACRNIEKAKDLVGLGSLDIISLTSLHDALSEMDLVFAATTSQLPLIGKGAVESAMASRRDRQMLIFDMAVPRDVENEVAQLSNVHLHTVDDLKIVAQENIKSREHAAVKSHDVIAEGARKYIEWIQKNDRASSVKALRLHADAIRDNELKRALRALKQGDNPEEIMTYLAHTLTNKLMHQPSEQARAASEAGHDEFLKTLHKVFGL